MTGHLKIHTVVLFTLRQDYYGHLKPWRRGLKVSPLLNSKATQLWNPSSMSHLFITYISRMILKEFCHYCMLVEE